MNNFEINSLSDFKNLSRAISFIENNVAGYETMLENLPATSASKIIGITGPPGVGKSTLVNSLLHTIIAENKKAAVLAVDPSSPFYFGALLGDRIRMNEHYTHPDIFIRSLATRGTLGGVPAKIIEITDVVAAAGFDYIIIETVGVGQSEVEIAGIADITIVVLAPDAGDEIQNMKAGLMEIADIFVVNKSDRPGAAEFFHHLQSYTFRQKKNEIIIPVVQTIATQQKGIGKLVEAIGVQQKKIQQNASRKAALLADKAYQLMVAERMKDVSQKNLQEEIAQLLQSGNFNLYQWIKENRK